MATIFTTRKPKHFEHKSYFGEKNERKAWLEARVRKVKREMGELPDEELRAEEVIRGTFIEGTKHLKRRKEKDAQDGTDKNSRFVKLGVALMMLLLIFFYLIKSL